MTGPNIRVIHHIWIGGRIPIGYQRFLRSWADHHPDWGIIVWDERRLSDLEMRNRALYDAAEDECPRDAIRWRVDIARLEILYQYGGVYVDCDTACLRPVDPLLAYDAFFPRSPNDRSLVTNAVMGARPRHPFLDLLLDGLAENALARRGLPLPETVGGRYITRQLEAHRPGDVTILPAHLFSSTSIRARRLGQPPTPHPDAYCDHRYDNDLWRPRGIQS